MADPSLDAIKTTTDRNYWVPRLNCETSMINYWVESAKNVEWWINTEQERSGAR